MRIIRILFLLVALLMILATGAPIAGAQTYLGEFCWGYTENLPPGDLSAIIVFPLKAGVTHLGGAYYLFQGQVNSALGGNPLFIQATALVVGDEIWISGNTTKEYATDPTERDSGIMQARLDLSTLSGTFWRTLSNVVLLDGVHPSYAQAHLTGTLTFRGGCP